MFHWQSGEMWRRKLVRDFSAVGSFDHWVSAIHAITHSFDAGHVVIQDRLAILISVYVIGGKVVLHRIFERGEATILEVLGNQIFIT